MIYWLAALQSVPQDVVEAAKIDGAGKWQEFRYITVPIILPIGGVIVLLAVINSLKVFDIVQTMTGGGPFFLQQMLWELLYIGLHMQAQSECRVSDMPVQPLCCSAFVLF